jgi:hypothetical protein
MITALHISLCILAVYSCTREGMLLARPKAAIQSFLDRVLGVVWSEWLAKPLFGCLTCMSSVYGVVFCFAFGVPLSEWIITVLTVCGINTVFSALLKYIHYEEQI